MKVSNLVIVFRSVKEAFVEVEHYTKRVKTVSVETSVNSESELKAKLKEIYNAILDAGAIPTNCDLSIFPSDVKGQPKTLTGTIKCGFIDEAFNTVPKQAGY